MAYGKSIELFLVNGTADSLITAELSNWNGKAIKISRIEVASCSRTDISQRMAVHLRKSRTTLRWIKPFNYCDNNSDYLQKARKYGHFTGYKN